MDVEFNRLLAKVIIQILNPMWKKNENFRLICNITLLCCPQDFRNFILESKSKPWEYIKLICNHYYDCNQYEYCISYSELVELYPHEPINDLVVIEKICLKVMSEQPKSVLDFKNGKTNSINRLKGQAMKLTNGKVNINLIESTLHKLLST